MNIRLPLALLLLAAIASGCASIPLDPPPTDGCADAPAPGERMPSPEYCQRRYLIVGFFPSVGEHHLNEISTKSMPLTRMRRFTDLTLVPAIVGFVNVTGLGLPTLYGWMYEPGQSYEQDPGACTYTALGICKAAMSIPRPGYVAPGELVDPEAVDAVPAPRKGRTGKEWMP